MVFSRLTALVFVLFFAGAGPCLNAAELKGSPEKPAASNAANPAGSLMLDDRAPSFDAWPVVTVLADPDRTLTVDAVLASLDKFASPVSAHAALGFRKEAIWLRVPLQVAAESDGQWIFDVDYALLPQ